MCYYYCCMKLELFLLLLLVCSFLLLFCLTWYFFDRFFFGRMIFLCSTTYDVWKPQTMYAKFEINEEKWFHKPLNRRLKIENRQKVKEHYVQYQRLTFKFNYGWVAYFLFCLEYDMSIRIFHGIVLDSICRLCVLQRYSLPNITETHHCDHFY
jgi:hypothetical protein